MRRLVSVGVLVVFWLAQAGPLLAATYYVRKTGDDGNSGTSAGQAWLTIQQAADSMVAGDIVYIGAGTYAEELRAVASGTSGAPIRFIADIAGTFTGDTGAVLLEKGNKEVLKVDGFDYNEFSAFRFTNSKKLKIKNAVGIVLQGCEIDSMSDKGIDLEDATLSLTDCTIHDNKKAGLKAKAKNASAVVTLTNTSIYDNDDKGIDVDSASVTLTGSAIYGNKKEGIKAKKSGAVITLATTSVYANEEAGIQLEQSAQLDATRCTIRDNKKPGVYAKDSTATLTNCLIYGNLEEGILTEDGTPGLTIWHSTIADNGKDGIYQRAGTTTLTNSIIANNTEDGLNDDGNGGMTHTYNLVYGNAANYAGTTSASTGEISSDPLFQGATDFHLQSGSPAIDVGTDGSSATSVDFDNESRPKGSGWDMGAYETNAGISHFVISHDGAGVHCLAESITVTAKDLSGVTVTDYTGDITLDTQTSKGTWSDGGNNGTFNDATANDGLATYTFDAADNGVAVFNLNYLEGAVPVDVDVFETAATSVRDDDTEGSIAFSPSGFTATASALSNPPPNPINDPIGNQTAGTSFTLHLAAYGTTDTDPNCGVIETYTGSKTLKFWSTYSDPSSGTVNVTVDGISIATSEGAASGQGVTFTNGQASVATKYKDAGQIRVSMTDDTVAEPAGGIDGQSALFVVKPADFAITAIERTDDSANPAAITPAGDVFVAAGAPFHVTVEVRDSEGARTPNYGNESSAEGIQLVASTFVAPLGGRNGTSGTGVIGNDTAFSSIAPAGTFKGTAFYWDEVGAMQLTASVSDADYLGAGDVTGTESGDVGRFNPDHFDVAKNTPEFSTFCAAGSFTYVGQDFDYTSGEEPVVTVTARNVQGTTTENYEGSWFLLSSGTLTGLAYTAFAGTLAVSAPNSPTVDDSTNGVGTLTFDQGPAQSFSRTTEVAPFDADLKLEVNVLDSDGVAYAGNPLAFGDATAGNGILFSSGNEIRFGRLRLENGHDSELVTLSIPLHAQYWNGTGFVTNAVDSCTQLQTTELSLTPNPGGLSTTPAVANSPLVSGDAGLSLSATGVGNTGYFDLVWDLSTATGEDLPYLQGDWDGDSSYDDNPAARATFGIYQGSAYMIYLHELY